VSVIPVNNNLSFFFFFFFFSRGNAKRGNAMTIEDIALLIRRALSN
jgi:hypothetical protein